MASIAIVVGILAPWSLWRYGARLRSKSKFAVRDIDERTP